MIKNERNYSGLKIIMRIGFVCSSIIYIIYSIVHVINGGEPFIFAGYIPVYAFMFGQIPASLLLGIAALYIKFYKRMPLAIFRKEFWSFIISIIALVALLLSVLLTDGMYL